MAIQQDAINNEQQTKEQESNNQESQAQEYVDPIEQIAAAVESEREKQRNDAEPEPAQDQQQAVDQQIEAADITQQRVKVKLEGVEEEVEIKDLIAGYQKNSVASKRLNEATQKLREAEEVLAKAREQAAQTGESVAGESGAVDVAKQVVESLLDGNTDEAAEMLAKLAGRGESSTPEVDAESVAQKVKQQLDRESALTKFEQDFGDIVADPYLTGLANERLKEQLNEKQAIGEPIDLNAELSAAGEYVRDWLKSKGVATTAEQSSTTVNERVARKQGLDSTPVLNASAGSATEQPETAASIIEEMRRERGITI